MSADNAKTVHDDFEVAREFMRRVKDFKRGDIVAIYGMRSEYTVVRYDKNRDEVTVSDGMHVYMDEWAGKYYLVKRVRYEDVKPPNEALQQACRSYMSRMGHDRLPRHGGSVLDD